MTILKFGGSSLASADSIKRVIEIVRKPRASAVKAVICSAFGGVTDSLLSLIATAKNGEDVSLSELKIRHKQIAAELVTGEALRQTEHLIEEQFSHVADVLKALAVIKEDTGKSHAEIVSLGEILSSQIVTFALNERDTKSAWLDARKLIKTDGGFKAAKVLKGESYAKIHEAVRDLAEIAIIPGFIGSNSSGDTTTLGRGGSDYTASLVAGALGASSLEIWTDVDGVLTADPRIVPDAFVVDELLFEEALELCHFGAKVISPPTLQPIRNTDTKLLIKNTFKPELSGTLITKQLLKERRTITGITSLRDISLITLSGPGLVGVTGSASRLFGALAAKEINIILIAQASSENSICFALHKEFRAKAVETIRAEFALEMETGRVDELAVEDDVAVIAVVGQGMRQLPGTASAVFGSLASSRISVIAISQGANERNISFVVSAADEQAALNTIHRKFFLDVTRVNVILLGPGQVGRSLLEQLEAQKEALLTIRRLDIHLLGIANSKKVLVRPQGIPIDEALECLVSEGISYTSPDQLLELIEAPKVSHTVVIDCTASDSFSKLYRDLLELKIPIVTSNKKVQTGPAELFHELIQISCEKEVPIRFETSVGAALPVISTLQEILLTGDKIQKIEATLSGTLSYLFNEYIEGKPFAELVIKAKELGYTEPDPREDLSGMDVARKLLILARTAGYSLELNQIQLGSILPVEIMEAESIEEFLNVLPHASKELDSLRDKALKHNERIHYLASFDGEEASIGLTLFSPSSPFHGLRGTDNMIAFYTERYPVHPLVVRGAGAGPDVTASGVFSDLIRIVQRRGTY